MWAACCNPQVLGDKSMQIKYLNPNVLFAAAGLPDGQPLLPGAPSPQLRIELLDTVTGRVLASFVHKVLAPLLVAWMRLHLH